MSPITSSGKPSKTLISKEESAARIFSAEAENTKKTSNGTRILIATGLFPPDIGGPAQYAKHLHDELRKQGHTVHAVSFRRERNLPPGIRHFFYCMRILPYVRTCDYIIAMDTFSVGFPAVLAAVIYGKRIAIRIGGDFLWESYVERAKKAVTLKEFNRSMPHLNIKERIIFRVSRFTLRHASVLAFNSEWQKNMFRDSYTLDPKKLFVIENFYGEKIEGREPVKKNFLWAGRMMYLKNTDMLKRAFADARKKRNDISLEMITGMRYEDLKEKIRECYAVILPSLSDVHPNFIIDALQMNKPFIMTRESGVRERLSDTGLFIHPNDERDLTEKILFLADDTNYKEYAKRAEAFRYTHSWENMAREFTDLYQKI
ncbi:MAG: glycosyltransferase family 4 protein [bacterium]|nr:glycosyltransferase family 4 protein [bacterium]